MRFETGRRIIAAAKQCSIQLYDASHWFLELRGLKRVTTLD